MGNVTVNKAIMDVGQSHHRLALIEGWIIFLLIAQNIHGEPILEMLPQVDQRWMAPDPICADLPDGIHPDLSQACRIFVACSSETRVATFWCVRGYVFSSDTGRCEPPDRVKCVSSRYTNSNYRRNQHKGIERQPTQEDGLYPDFSSGCSSFDYVQDGKKTSFRCPQQFLFDWRTSACRQSSDVSCKPLSCDGKKDGIYPDINNYCKRYLRCSSGNATEHICPPGEIFDVRNKRCTRTSSVICAVAEGNQCFGLPDGYYPDYSRGCKAFELCLNGQLKSFNCPAKTTFSRQSLTCENSNECLRPQVDKCKNKINGPHPNYETGCRDFYICLDGNLIKEGSCPLGKLLNPISGICQPSSSVTCSPVDYPDCLGLKDGVYPDYSTGCSAYYLCLHQKRIATTFCPGNDLFDVATGTCLPSGFVTCTRPLELAFTPKLLDSYDCNGRVGLYPEFSSQCRKFVVCAYGHKGIYECPEGTWFDVETNSCQKNITACSSPSVISTFQCLPADEGVYVSSSCNQWHECRKGVGFVIECPPGQMYHLNLGKCVINDTTCGETVRVRKSITGTSEINVFEDENSIFDCSDRLNAVYSDQICRVFHICAEKKLFSFSCPSSMSFHEETWQCQPLKDDSNCPSEDFSSSEMKKHTFDCSRVPDGMYADHSAECKRYYVCEGGNSVLVYCPEGQKFSTVKMVCDREDRVSCVNSTKDEIDWGDLIYHVEGSTLETQEIFNINIDDNPASSKHGINETHTDLPINTDRSVRNNTQQPNSILEKASQNKRNHIFKGSSINVGHTNHIQLLGSQQTTQPFTPCSNGDTGFFPDYDSNCKKFHICFRTIRKTYSCPSVLLFNPESKNCDLPENVQCTPPELLNASSYDCSIFANQYYPDFTSSCQKYIGCIGDIPYKFTCPPGRLFDPDSRSCVSSSSVNCTERNDTNRKLDTKVSSVSRIPSYRRVHGNRRNSFDCAQKADGFYPDYGRHCHVFYRCIRGKKFSHYCKQGLLFNPVSGICDFEENVTCHSGSGEHHVETSRPKSRSL